MNIREIWWKVVGWMNLAQNRNKWRDLVERVTNLRIIKKVGNSLSS
jgi:fatty-acid desaturase